MPRLSLCFGALFLTVAIFAGWHRWPTLAFVAAVWAIALLLPVIVGFFYDRAHRDLLPVFLCFLALTVSSGAFADTAQATNTVDFSAAANAVIQSLFAAIGAWAVWVARRLVKLLEDRRVVTAAQIHDDAVTKAVADAVTWVEARLEQIVDPLMKYSFHDSAVAEAARMAAQSEPAAIKALGLDPAAVAARVQLALGPAVLPAPASPAEVAADPATPPAPLAPGAAS